MQSAEYEKLDRIDAEHWFYRGKRAIVRYFIQRNVALQPDDLLIDAGTGTGRWPVAMSRRCRVIGLDDHDESIAIARPRLESVGGQLVQTRLDDIPLPSQCATVVTAMDVLEHLDDDAGAVSELSRLVRPGGLMVITVPALRWLWSDWDVVLHHRRRYHRTDLRRLLDRPDLELLHLNYTNALALPLIVLVRMWRKWFPPGSKAGRAEDAVPPTVINSLLRAMYVYPAQWKVPMPAGVSLLAVLRKK